MNNDTFTMIEETLGDFLGNMAEKQPDHESVVYTFRDLRWTYRELDILTDTLAKGLMKMGVKKGDHVAVWAHNVPEWILLLFATAKIGSVLVTVNTLYRAHELEYLLRQSDSVMLFLDPGVKVDFIDTVYEILPELKHMEPGAEIDNEKVPMLKKVVLIGGEEKPGMLGFDRIFEYAPFVTDEELAAVEKTLDRHDVINMQYTSGTTGFPKGVMLSHFNILNNAYAIGQGMRFTPADRLCIPVPFFHCFGLVLSILVCISHGATMCPTETFNPKTVLETVEREKCTALHGVPTMFISELNLLDETPYDTSSLRTGIMAGSTCPVDTMRQVIDRMNMTDITIVYGQTEASPGMTQTLPDDALDTRCETVGKEMPGAEVKIVNPETGEECPPNVPGELWGRGYNVMRGYYKMDEATRAAYSEDGWLKTGDIAVKTEDGYYKITGRIKDMIIRGGENIYPREIEEFLHRHPDVDDVQVVGVADKKYGEEVMAFIRARRDSGVSEETLRAYCKGKIADYKVPKYFRFIDEYPMTASGKIQKFKLRELGEQTLQA